MNRICLLDLNYTLVKNQMETRMLRPFARRMEAEEYRTDLIEAIRGDHVIIITARPDYQMRQTMGSGRGILQRHQCGSSDFQGECLAPVYFPPAWKRWSCYFLRRRKQS